MREAITRRDFLKVVIDIGAKSSLLPFIDKLSLTDPSEAPITVEWVPTQNADVERYFKLADSPWQRWEYQYAIDENFLLYGLAVDAEVAESPLDTGKLLYETYQPVAEMFKQSIHVNEAGFFENSEGRIIRASVDPRIVSNALEQFSHRYQVDYFLYRLAAVPKDSLSKTATLRYVKDLPPEAQQYITSGPLSAPEPYTPTHPVAYHPVAVYSDLLFSDVVRVTGQNGMYGYYMAKVHYRDQVT